MSRHVATNKLYPVLELSGMRGIPPTAVVDPHLIHGVKVSALSAPRCRPPTTFFLVRPPLAERTHSVGNNETHK